MPLCNPDINRHERVIAGKVLLTAAAVSWALRRGVCGRWSSPNHGTGRAKPIMPGLASGL